MPEIHLLKSGSILRDEAGRILDARSSVTLVISGPSKIVVDTGLAGEEKKIIAALADKGLEPEDIDLLINTHSHADHCGNNHLFCKAGLLVPKEGEIIAPGVWSMETPGHSLDSISVVVKTSKAVVIAGDALPTFGNFLKNVPPALNVDRALAVSSMSRIIDMAEIVIPGHDRPFSIAERKYIKL
jgi:N-acyl homoserine lactone hydrolase